MLLAGLTKSFTTPQILPKYPDKSFNKLRLHIIDPFEAKSPPRKCFLSIFKHEIFLKHSTRILDEQQSDLTTELNMQYVYLLAQAVLGVNSIEKS